MFFHVSKHPLTLDERMTCARICLLVSQSADAARFASDPNRVALKVSAWKNKLMNYVPFRDMDKVARADRLADAFAQMQDKGVFRLMSAAEITNELATKSNGAGAYCEILNLWALFPETQRQQVKGVETIESPLDVPPLLAQSWGIKVA